MGNRVIHLYGDPAAAGGTYLLRIAVSAACAVRFGRFKQGRPIHLPAGEYAYVGSALARKGAASPGRRLIRHATRSDNQPPHAIRAGMLAVFAGAGLGEDLLPRRGKSLHWHLDYLLDEPAAEIGEVIVLRADRPYEEELAAWLFDHPAACVVEKGLGAQDSGQITHFFRLLDGDQVWRAAAAMIGSL